MVACDNYDRANVEQSIEKAINLLGGISQFIRPGMKVLIKPNLCLAEPPDKCLTTHPEIIRKIALMSSQAGAEVIVGDNPVGDADRSRLNAIWERTGVASVLEGVPYERSFLDSSMIAFSSSINGKDYSFYISEDILSLDLIINIPKFKTHSLMNYTGAVKNLYGLLPGNSKRKLHSELPVQEDFAALLTDIYKLVSPRLNIMDAVIGIEGDGPGVQGTKRKIGLILASDDGIALDSVATRLMNLDPEAVHTNRIGGEKGLGEVDENNIEILGECLEQYVMRDFKHPMTFRFSADITHKLFSLSGVSVRINRDECKACGLCIKNCPAGSIQIKDKTAVIDGKTCISCMTCHEICPEGAVSTGRSTFYTQLKSLRNKKK